MRSAATLASTSLVNSGLGFVYWAVAARAFPATDVGESATTIAAMNVIAPLTLLGFGTLLVAELPGRVAGRPALVSTAALVAAVSGGLVALCCALLLPHRFVGLPGIGHEIGVTALFVAAVATQGVGLLLDQALLSVTGGGVQLRRNTIHATVKLSFLVPAAVLLSGPGSVSIVASWFVANVVSVAAVGALLMRRYRIRPGGLRPAWSALRGLNFVAGRHHALNVALFVPFFAMPIVANATLGPESAAYLYASWSVAGLVFNLPLAVVTALFAAGMRDPDTFAAQYRLSLRSSLAMSAAAVAGIAALGGVVLSVFGADYAANGRVALIVMCLGGVALVVKDHHVALARVTGRVGREAALIAALSALEMIGAAVGATRGGLVGLSLGWLIGVAVGATVCAPRVVRAYRLGSPGRHGAPA